MPFEKRMINLENPMGSPYPLNFTMQNQTPLKFTSNGATYQARRNTFSLDMGGCASPNPLDGNYQRSFERSHGGALSTRFTQSDTRNTATFGLANNKVKYIRDADGAGIGWESKHRHNKAFTSHFEVGVRNNNGTVGGFWRWALGFN
jgi:hypothetical protein